MQLEVLGALAQPHRLRIVELLADAPRSVGEITDCVGLRQPQATKHLQTLEAAGLVTVHPLGQRRIYALRREPLRQLRAWLEPFEEAHASEDVLVQYRAAIDAERARSERDPGAERTLVFERRLAAPPAAVWRAWTSPEAVRGWWSPRHFRVAEAEVEPVVGGRLRIVMEEPDGTRHQAAGQFLVVDPPAGLCFELAPLGPSGEPLFSAVHDLELTAAEPGTDLRLAIRVGGRSGPDAVPALAGMRLGWDQLLDKLTAHLRSDGADADAQP